MSNLAELMIVGKVSCQGDQRVIVIPKEQHAKLNPLKNKKYKIEIQISEV